MQICRIDKKYQYLETYTLVFDFSVYGLINTKHTAEYAMIIAA
jgi:hypothetical protein